MAILPEKLIEIAQQAANAPHGKKGDVYAQACELLQVSYATLMRELKQFSAQRNRKQRSDKGNVALDLKEAQIISAYWLACRRGVNNKVMSSLASVLEVLRAKSKRNTLTKPPAKCGCCRKVRSIVHYAPTTCTPNNFLARHR